MTIYQTFESLKPEKRSRIIRAAMHEFAKNGYANASTDTIVRHAGISKGALFHYFGSKKNLYLYLCAFGSDMLAQELLGKIDVNERDMFRRLKQIAVAKLELVRRFPDIIDFLMSVHMEEDPAVRTHLQNRANNLSETAHDVLSNFDNSLFRAGIDPAKALDIITWTINGLVERAMQQVRADPEQAIDYPALFAEADAYLEMLRHGFYK